MITSKNEINCPIENTPDDCCDVQLGMFDALGISRNKYEIMIWKMDPELRRFHFFDEQKHQILSFSFEEIKKYVHPDNMKIFRHMTSNPPEDDWQGIQQIIRMQVKGSWRRFFIKGVINAAQHKPFIFGIAYDIDMLCALHQRIEYLETHDALTGLVNFNSFNGRFERLTRFGMYPLSLVIIRIENLGDACCALGYQSSNAMIRSVADVLRECFFDADIIGRTGSGEYCAAFTGKDQLEIETRVNEAAMKMHSTYLNLIKTEVSFGYSIAECEKDFRSMYQESYQKLVRKRSMQMHLSHDSVIDSLNAMVSIKAGWGKRAIRLQSLSVQVGKALGCKEDVISETKLLAKIADIGFVGISESLLLRRFQLSEKETEAYNSHIEYGRELINRTDSLAYLEGLYMDVFKRYDEWQDAIAIPSRVVSAVRGFDDIMLSENKIPYKDLKNRLLSRKGKQYCPEVVDLLLKLAKKQHTWPSA